MNKYYLFLFCLFLLPYKNSIKGSATPPNTPSDTDQAVPKKALFSMFPISGSKSYITSLAKKISGSLTAIKAEEIKTALDHPTNSKK